MDSESWLQGYFTGVSLHGHLRVPYRRPSVIASMSVTGIAADFDWFADLSGVEALTMLTAEYTGSVTVAHSYDGKSYTAPVALSELLGASPAELFRGCNPDAPRLWFRFRLADDKADLTGLTLWGFFASGGAANAV